ncbi:hypothetical protein C8Q80DRAFT_643321 [Daedaleopsis nitida]|nr:hypothetical protein C8Q80DRAFT_643321 [Daedaleopsis nitida]
MSDWAFCFHPRPKSTAHDPVPIKYELRNSILYDSRRGRAQFSARRAPHLPPGHHVERAPPSPSSHAKCLSRSRIPDRVRNQVRIANITSYCAYTPSYPSHRAHQACSQNPRSSCRTKVATHSTFPQRRHCKHSNRPPFCVGVTALRSGLLQLRCGLRSAPLFYIQTTAAGVRARTPGLTQRGCETLASPLSAGVIDSTVGSPSRRAQVRRLKRI